MNRSLFRREVLPLTLLFAALVAATLLVDAGLHKADSVWVGRYLGIPGVLLIAASMLYSLRKRKVVAVGNPASLLKMHKAMAWSGSLLVMVHAGIHFNAVLPWLAIAAMLANVVSGLVGTFLLGRARTHVESRRKAMVERGLSPSEIETRLFGDASTLDLLKGWRVVHLPIALAFATLAVGHILVIFLFWGWR